MDKGISSEKFVALLVENIKSKKMIIDVTHCFRNIPMKLLLTLNYIEKCSSTSIEHLYYGRLETDNTSAIIEDAINGYNMQELSSVLELFEKTLYLSNNTITKAYSDDQLIKNLVL